MAWTPTYNILTPRAIPSNLATYCLDATRQGEALTWAGDGTLKLVKTLQNSIAEPTKPVYPAISFSSDDDAEEFGDEMIEGAYVCTFEFWIQHAAAGTAVTNARVYDKAFRSMIANCPTATLITGTGATTAKLLGLETSFEVIKTNEMRNDFLQVFQIRCSYVLFAGLNA